MLWAHSAVVLGDRVYTFGGQNGRGGIDTNSYVYYQSDWSVEDGLRKKKWYHRSIVIGDDVYHVGGDYYYGGEPKWIEKWKKSKTNFEKEIKELIDEDALDSRGWL